LDNLSKILSGPKFIPFRKNISKLPVNIEQDELVITVVGGGADYKNFVPEMAKNLAKIPGIFTVNLFTNNPNGIINDPRFKIFD
jgi:spore coat polysaccharide biosynthesis predicted glycosyltransferase SpsG